MSSFRNHRVVIASLFLPNTAILGESHPPTPDERTALHSPRPLPLPTAFPGHGKDQGFKRSLPPSRARTPAPIPSIVEDLKDKASPGTSHAVTKPDHPDPSKFVSLFHVYASLRMTELPVRRGLI